MLKTLQTMWKCLKYFTKLCHVVNKVFSDLQTLNNSLNYCFFNINKLVLVFSWLLPPLHGSSSLIGKEGEKETLRTTSFSVRKEFHSLEDIS